MCELLVKLNVTLSGLHVSSTLWSLVVSASAPPSSLLRKLSFCCPFLHALLVGAAGTQALRGPVAEVDGGAQIHKPLGTLKELPLANLLRHVLISHKGEEEISS